MKTILLSISLAATALLAAACNDNDTNYTMHRPATHELPAGLPVVEGIHTYKAPLYWSVYEYCLEEERAGNRQIDITRDEWQGIIDFVATQLLPHGYDMVCTDGFISMTSDGSVPYMTHYGSMPLRDLVQMCRAKGLRLGIYDNPLWIHCPNETLVPGTDITVGSLRYAGDAVAYPSANDTFTYAIPSHKGFREFIDGFFKYYKELGVDFIRMDFLSWFEDGTDRYMGVTGKGYGRDNYAFALAYIAEAAKKYGVFTSLAMPHLYNDAELEARYANMTRIVSDAGDGGWGHTSENDRGKSYATWSQCMNQFDGFAYWSHIAGRDKIILDGDFLRMQQYASDDERRAAITLQLMAGGPVTPCEKPVTMNGRPATAAPYVGFYTNDELLALNADRFVGRPLSEKLGDATPVWYGQMQNGDWVVALFNRESAPRQVSAPLAQLGITGPHAVRDLWLHADEGTVEGTFAATVPAHGCKVVRLKR